VNPKDRTVAPVFGDGGSATLIEYSEGAGLAQFSLETDGSGFEKLIVPAGGMRQPCSERTAKETVDAEGNQRSLENLFMDGAEIFNFSISMEPQSVKELLDYASLSTDEVDYFVFHQANRYILENIAKRLKLDTKKVPMQTVERYGNQSSASIPCALSGELSNALLKGNPKQVLLSGFGVGLSWASVILDLSGLQVCKIIEHDPVD
jgi:3-oxoacyl-[acyl-carrier-protein] synthase-3